MAHRITLWVFVWLLCISCMWGGMWSPGGDVTRAGEGGIGGLRVPGDPMRGAAWGLDPPVTTFPYYEDLDGAVEDFHQLILGPEFANVTNMCGRFENDKATLAGQFENLAASTVYGCMIIDARSAFMPYDQFNGNKYLEWRQDRGMDKDANLVLGCIRRFGSEMDSCTDYSGYAMVRSREFDLSAINGGTHKVMLTFDVLSRHTAWAVDVSVNDAPYSQVLASFFTPSAAGWVERRVDLSAYAGSRVRLRFRAGEYRPTYSSHPPSPSIGVGVLFDQIAVEVEPITCLSLADCRYPPVLDFATISTAIQGASDGATVGVASGTYRGCVTVPLLDKHVTVESVGGPVVIDCAHALAGPLFRLSTSVSSGIVLRGIEFQRIVVSMIQFDGTGSVPAEVTLDRVVFRSPLADPLLGQPDSADFPASVVSLFTVTNTQVVDGHPNSQLLHGLVTELRMENVTLHGLSVKLTNTRVDWHNVRLLGGALPETPLLGSPAVRAMSEKLTLSYTRLEDVEIEVIAEATLLSSSSSASVRGLVVGTRDPLPKVILGVTAIGGVERVRVNGSLLLTVNPVHVASRPVVRDVRVVSDQHRGGVILSASTTGMVLEDLEVTGPGRPLELQSADAGTALFTFRRAVFSDIGTAVRLEGFVELVDVRFRGPQSVTGCLELVCVGGCTASLEHVSMHECVSHEDGGALEVSRFDVTLSNVTIGDAVALGWGGGISAHASTVRVRGPLPSVIEGCAALAGGGIHTVDAEINGTWHGSALLVLRDNFALEGSGVSAMAVSTLSISISGLRVLGSRGGPAIQVALQGTSVGAVSTMHVALVAPIEVSGTMNIDSLGPDGGAFLMSCSVVSAQSDACWARVHLGAAAGAPDARIVLRDNHARSGAGISVAGSADTSWLTTDPGVLWVANNTALEHGGGIVARRMDVDLGEGTLVVGNSAGGEGAGLYLDEGAVVRLGRGTVVASNVASKGGAFAVGRGCVNITEEALAGGAAVLRNNRATNSGGLGFVSLQSLGCDWDRILEMSEGSTTDGYGRRLSSPPTSFLLSHDAAVDLERLVVNSGRFLPPVSASFQDHFGNTVNSARVVASVLIPEEHRADVEFFGAAWYDVKPGHPTRIDALGFRLLSDAVTEVPGVVVELQVVGTSLAPTMLRLTVAGCGPGQSGVSQCALCEAGYYSDETTRLETSECVACPAGTFSEAGAVACVPCAAGTASGVAALPVPCPACDFGTFQTREGATECLRCDTGKATCHGTEVMARPGYWVVADDDGRMEITACLDGYCGLGNNTCSDHRSGFLCGDCEVGYSLKKGRCVRCTKASWLAIASMAVTLLGMAALLSWRNQKERPSALSDIVLFFGQGMALVVASDSRQPADGWDALWNLFLVDGDMLPSECLGPMDFYQRFLFSCTSPLLIFVAIALMWVLELGLARVPGLAKFFGSRTPKGGRYRSAVAGGVLFVFIPILRAALSVIHCRRVTEDSPQELLVADQTVVCVTEDGDVPGTYALFRGIAIVVAVTMLLVPFLVLAFLLRLRKRHGEEGVWEGDVRRRYGVLYAAFRRSAYWWLFVALIRKAVLVTLVVFLAHNMEMRSSVITQVLVALLVTEVTLRPYHAPRETWIDAVLVGTLAGLACLIDSMWWSAYLEEGDASTGMLVVWVLLLAGGIAAGVVIAVLASRRSQRRVHPPKAIASSAASDETASSATGDETASSATGDETASSATGDETASSA